MVSFLNLLIVDHKHHTHQCFVVIFGFVSAFRANGMRIIIVDDKGVKRNVNEDIYI